MFDVCVDVNVVFYLSLKRRNVSCLLLWVLQSVAGRWRNAVGTGEVWGSGGWQTHVATTKVLRRGTMSCSGYSQGLSTCPSLLSLLWFSLLLLFLMRGGVWLQSYCGVLHSASYMCLLYDTVIYNGIFEWIVGEGVRQAKGRVLTGHPLNKVSCTPKSRNERDFLSLEMVLSYATLMNV